ncbi:hypothetical protein ACFOOK_24750 [Micromonospora krabiensis]|uniref:Uncharacterized protein n=1 Tax=Micromonospora krabiensis TaxID=307121 RepID=A0A1C3N6M5_9ACTN|nr:hypothetical protein [Micromonospora krabiensis]SBV28228.1 hypothetical protein GA0070620_3762 [Micromonospora krabiensis]
MLDERELADLMRSEVEAAETRSTVLDVDRAMTRGRRQRRYAQGGAAALLVGALVVGGMTAPNLLPPDHAPLGTGSADGTSVEGATGLPAALTVVDPTVRHVRFGWLPDGVRAVQYQAGLLQSGPGVYLGATTSAPGARWRGVSVNLYPEGVEPSAPQRDDGVPAGPLGTSVGPDLNGRPSTFARYSGADQPEAILRWRYAPGGWAQVRVFGGPGDASDTAVRVARALRFGHDPVPLPVPVRGVPDTLRLITLDVSETRGDELSWSAWTTWSPEPSGAAPAQQRARTLSVGFSRHRPDTDPGDKAHPDPNTTVGGHPARFGGQGGDESLIVYDVNGVDVSVDDRGLLPAGGTRALFGRLAVDPAAARWIPHLHP